MKGRSVNKEDPCHSLVGVGTGECERVVRPQPQWRSLRCSALTATTRRRPR